MQHNEMYFQLEVTKRREEKKLIEIPNIKGFILKVRNPKAMTVSKGI